ncbi:MAG: hypothetical protein CBC71_06300 [Rhodobacteraceae bacterium TMED111]|nr:hypothetical protein [Marinovum sp.]OUV41109.1 MAG: hypothetical protein CBC71_06300 [Rhodobacteraceae bacterium TMED111]|tara:strand:+ start:12799 stop:14421 length:1623 start_codon:yes stop_codon:yes gene_type:complete
MKIGLSLGLNKRSLIEGLLPIIERTTGFPSTDAVSVDMSEGFSAVVKGTMTRSNAVDFQFILSLYQDNNNVVRILRRNASGKFFMQLRIGGNQNSFPLEFDEELVPDGSDFAMGFVVKDGLFEVYVNGLRVAYMDDPARTMPANMDTVYAGKFTGASNDFQGTLSSLKVWDATLTRAQMERETRLTDMLNSPTNTGDKFTIWAGNSNANGVDSVSGNVIYENTLQQFGKDLQNGLKAYSDPTGGDTSIFGDFWNISGSGGFSGIGKYADLRTTQTGVNTVSVPMGQGGLLLSIASGQNNMSAKVPTGLGYYVSPRACSILKTIDACKQYGGMESLVLILGHNEAGQGISSAVFEQDLDDLFDVIHYYHPSLKVYLVGMQDWQAGIGISETDWNEAKDTITNYSRDNISVIDGNWDVISGDEIHLSEEGQVEVAEAVYLDGETQAPFRVQNTQAEGQNEQALVTFDEPLFNGGSPITNYICEYRRAGDSEWLVFNNAVSIVTMILVTGLTNGVEYEFRVKAVSTIGEGEFSLVVTATPSLL